MKEEHECKLDDFGYCSECGKELVEDPTTPDELLMDAGERQYEEEANEK